jgi:Tfp pilus assembly protein FimT
MERRARYRRQVRPSINAATRPRDSAAAKCTLAERSSAVSRYAATPGSAAPSRTPATAGVLLGAALPGVAAYLDTAELRSASVHFAAALSRGRVAALTEGRTWRLYLADARRYALGPQDGEDAEVAVEHLPGDAFFAGATSGGDVRFFPSGLVDNATFTLGAGDARRRVIVNQRGRVTVE